MKLLRFPNWKKRLSLLLVLGFLSILFFDAHWDYMGLSFQIPKVIAQNNLDMVCPVLTVPVLTVRNQSSGNLLQYGCYDGNYNLYSFMGVVYILSPPSFSDFSISYSRAITFMLPNGGFVDIRGLGATTQTISQTVIVGGASSPGKTITIFIDRTTTLNCIITNGTPCITVNGGGTIMAFGMVSYPNAGLVIAATANVSDGLLVTNNFASGLVGGFVEGLMVRALTGATVTNGICTVVNTLQLEKLLNGSCVSAGATNTVALKIGGTGSGQLSTNLNLDNMQVDCQGNTGCRPVWIGCAASGGISPISCGSGSIYSVNFFGGLAVHAGTGLPIVTIEASNGAGGANLIDNINFFGHQIENKNGDTTQIGFLIDGPASMHVNGEEVTCLGAGGADIFKLTNTAGVATDGIKLNFSLLCGWTNVINNTINGRIITTASVARMDDYVFHKSSSNLSSVWDDASGNLLSFDSNGLTLGSTFKISGGGVNRLVASNTPPTISSGFGTSPSITGNGTFSFSINVGTGGTANSGVIGLTATSNGWTCFFDDQTTPGVNETKQTANTTNSVTMTNFNTTTGAIAAWTASDIISGSCFGR